MSHNTFLGQHNSLINPDGSWFYIREENKNFILWLTFCDTQYKVTGSRKAVADLWNTLQELEVNSKNVYLYLLAEHYSIDYEKKGISVRGHIYWAEYEENVEDDYALLSFDTESAWSSCDLFFEEVNKALGNELSISWLEVEPGCDIFYTHDENDFFPEECYVTAYGELFEDCEGAYSTFGDAIKLWCEKDRYLTGRKKRTEDD